MIEDEDVIKKILKHISVKDILKLDMVRTIVGLCKEDISEKQWEQFMGTKKYKK